MLMKRKTCTMLKESPNVSNLKRNYTNIENRITSIYTNEMK